jgi:hypothetical protein
MIHFMEEKSLRHIKKSFEKLCPCQRRRPLRYPKRFKAYCSVNYQIVIGSYGVQGQVTDGLRAIATKSDCITIKATVLAEGKHFHPGYLAYHSDEPRGGQ